MSTLQSITFATIARWLLVLAVAIVPRAVWATTWQSVAGVQSFDEAIQVDAFLPNELWVHVGDSIAWTFPALEIHTVTFLKPGQIRPPRPGAANGGCPGTTPDHSNFDSSTCVTSDELVGGQTYTVNFPTAGNFKVVCLVHANMTGAVHVLEQSEALPYQQTFYDDQANTQWAGLLKDGAIQLGLVKARAQQNPGYQVTAGIGETVATGAGSNAVTVMRFTPDPIVVHVGDTVEWTNLDPMASHTVTFGTEPSGPPQPPSAGVTTDSDGARHALLASPTDSVHSGFLVAAPQDRVGLAQSNLAATRFRVTFTNPGTFHYICTLHDELGMTGDVIVRSSGQ
jgi:plastocyanin